jgi:putative transposase
MQRFKSARSAD